MERFNFEVAGVYYYTENLISVASKNSYFGKSDADIISHYEDGKRIYKYYFNRVVPELVPEPNNPHDRNAIMVTLNGKCIGHVPADLCVKVKSLMKKPYSIKVKVHGGPSKKVNGDDVLVNNYDFLVDVYISVDDQKGISTKHKVLSRLIDIAKRKK